jgi:hypothetical protein
MPVTQAFCNPRTELGIQFKASLDYTVRPCLKRNKACTLDIHQKNVVAFCLMRVFQI